LGVPDASLMKSSAMIDPGEILTMQFVLAEANCQMKWQQPSE
jgi:hypothetical protein